MREILFKAKRIDNGEWVEGYLFETREHAYIAYANQFDDDLFLSPQNIFIEVDPSTICQYTGLNDNHDNKIWENDIIRCGRNTVVSWDEHFARWCLTRKGWLFKHFVGEAQNPEDCEVIGNIFDNPELLEGGGEDE